MTVVDSISHTHTAEVAELVGLAQQIRAYQESRGWSDNQLVRRLQGLGSTKTYTRILRGDLAELDLDRWLSEYRAVWATIEALSERETVTEELYEDLTSVVQLRRALVGILAESSIRRVVLLEGDSGMGKTAALSFLRQKYGHRIVVVEATEVWGDSIYSFLGAVLEALGARELPNGRGERLQMVISKLNERRVALAIDEAHHLGKLCLNTLKTVVNATPGEIILIALPKLWRMLERSAWEEVRQLLGNRLAERIRLGSLRDGDAAKLLARRTGLEDAASASAIAKEARTRGNLSFVAAVCRRLTEQSDETPSPEAVLAAVAAEVARR